MFTLNYKHFILILIFNIFPRISRFNWSIFLTYQHFSRSWKCIQDLKKESFHDLSCRPAINIILNIYQDFTLKIFLTQCIHSDPVNNGYIFPNVKSNPSKYQSVPEIWEYRDILKANLCNIFYNGFNCVQLEYTTN